MSLYLALNLLAIAYPLWRAFEPRIAYGRHLLTLLVSLVLTACWFIPWDIAFTRAGIWGFTPQHLLGIYLWGLPMEEWLFFICIPFASVFIYACVCYFMPSVRFLTHRYACRLAVVLAVLLLVLAFFYADRRYTFWNSVCASAWLFLHGGLLRSSYLPQFFIAYLWHLIPFVLINGVLTGAVTEHPVVWYNNADTLALRFFTIPIEDFVYSLLLLLMPVTYYEVFKDYLSLPKAQTKGEMK